MPAPVRLQHPGEALKRGGTSIRIGSELGSGIERGGDRRDGRRTGGCASGGSGTGDSATSGLAAVARQ